MEVGSAVAVVEVVEAPLVTGDPRLNCAWALTDRLSSSKATVREIKEEAINAINQIKELGNQLAVR